MEATRKKQVLEILDYWKLIEFLGQNDVPREGTNNKKIIDKLKSGQEVSDPKVEIFMKLLTLQIQIGEEIEKHVSVFKDFPNIGNSVYFCLGELNRNNVVEHLKKFIDHPDESPEIAYPNKSAIAWYSFQTDVEGVYLNGSFRLSPVLWAISVWEERFIWGKHDFQINIEEYDGIVEKIDEELQEQNVSEFLEGLHKKIYRKWVEKRFPDCDGAIKGLFEYNRYTDEKEKDKDENPTDYSDLGKSYYLGDIIRFAQLIQSGKFGDGSAYEKKVISYILAGYEKTIGKKKEDRIVISPKEPALRMKRFFEEILHVNRAPLGKWPARFMPALMQQVAVNIAIDQGDQTPIFSVNGPPGTGKTTLLKEIVASNIVDRALLLAKQGSEPDTLFEKHLFHHGPIKEHGNSYFQYAPAYYSIKNDRINDYSMLVASCNNAAVENITKDLPKRGDILESLKVSKEDHEAVRNGLEEVRDLFDIDKSVDIETITVRRKSREEKDIFFTRYTNKLIGAEDCWGMVSAPFGKQSNIKKYCKEVLIPFVEDYQSRDTRSAHLEKYKVQRDLFLKQYELVISMRKEIEQLCNAAEDIPIELQGLSAEELSKLNCELAETKQSLFEQIKAEQRELMELEESRPRRLFFRHKNTTVRDGLIAEHKEKIAAMKHDLSDMDKKLADIRRVRDYRALLEQYTEGDKELKPIDGDFIKKYHSDDEKQMTKAQITNPWFTERYNREREKLFLYACKLHKEFVISSKCVRHNLINLLIAWNMFDECQERMYIADRKAAMSFLLQTVFLLTPVISTTFASAQTFLGDVEESGVFGTLIVDEAGQAPPQTAVGAMFRCRKAVIVGDPKQIEPVVTAEADMFQQLLASKVTDGYKDKKISVQGFADHINLYGTFLGQGEEEEWVGCPLVVHRRCIDPMYSISNWLSYDGTMRQQTAEPTPDRAASFILKESYWIDVCGCENSNAKDHFVGAQGEVVLKLLEEKFKKDQSAIPRLFIITPFTSVKAGMIDMIKKSALYKNESRVEAWLKDNNVGTVHTFQGQGTDEVIFLLGCDGNASGAVKWVNKNIVNVAATRAKFRFYVVGDKSVWSLCKPVKVALECIVNIVSAEELGRMLAGGGDGKEGNRF